MRTQTCVFRVNGKQKIFDTAVYRRELLPIDKEFKGPAIILQTDSTTILPPKAKAIVNKTGSIIITFGEKK
jgi:N-methylhydantoinase A